MRVISATEARNNFPEIMSLVAYGRQPFLVEKKGRPMVIIFPFEEKNIASVSSPAGMDPTKLAGTVSLPKNISIEDVFAAIKEPYDKECLFGR